MVCDRSVIVLGSFALRTCAAVCAHVRFKASFLPACACFRGWGCFSYLRVAHRQTPSVTPLSPVALLPEPR